MAQAADGTLNNFVPQLYPSGSLDELQLKLSWRLIGTARHWRRLLDQRLRSDGQTQPRWRVLAWAQMRPGITQTELAARIAITGPTLVRILDGLEAAGLVKRREGKDRRHKEIHLTADARPVIARISAEVESIRADLLSDVSPEDLRTCLTVLDRIDARIASASSAQDQLAL